MPNVSNKQRQPDENEPRAKDEKPTRWDMVEEGAEKVKERMEKEEEQRPDAT